MDDTYSFLKTARYEVPDKKWLAKWSDDGRYFVMYGRQMSSFGKTPMNIRFFNMFGELLHQYKDNQQLSGVYFRPRPLDILKPQTKEKLKKEYEKKYKKIFEDDERKEKESRDAVTKDQRKVERDDFLENFFLPQRQIYEENI